MSKKAMKEEDETPEMEAEEHSTGFLKKASAMASGKRRKKKGKSKGRAHKRVSVK
jgi:hypothetical protein